MAEDQLALQNKQLNTALEGAIAFQVNNQEDYNYVCSQMLVVKANSKYFETQKKSITDPINAGLKKVREQYKPIEDILDKLEEVYKGKIKVYEQAQKKLETDKLQEAARLFQAGKQEQGLVALNAVPEVAVVKQHGVSTRTVVKFRYTNPTLVPREFCAPVDALIRAQVGAFGMNTKIPGVEVYEDIQVAGRV